MSTKEKLDLLWKYLALIVIAILGLRFTENINSKYISNNVSIPVTMWDERLSTVGAFNLSSNLDINVSKKIKKLDENAASFILQGAIDYIRK